MRDWWTRIAGISRDAADRLGRRTRPTLRELGYLWSRRPAAAVLVFVLVALAVRMGKDPVYRGDGNEYLLMTRSLARDGNLWISESERGLFQQPGSPWPFVELRSGEYPLMTGADGRERCLHAPAVAALAVPFYWLCDWLGPQGGLFRCYSVFGLWCVLLGWYLLARHWEDARGRAPGRPERWGLRLLAAAAILFSPLGIYSYWPHAEAGIFLLLSLYFFWLAREQPVAAAIALGITAAQNPVCILWGILLAAQAWQRWRQTRTDREGVAALRRQLAALAIVPLPMIALGIHSLWLYGVWSLLPRYGSGIAALVSPGRTVRFFVDPFFGLVWFYPWIFLGLFAPAGRRAFFVRLLISVPIAAASTAVVNLNSQMVGLRYLVFVYPAFLFLPFAFPRRWAGRAAFGLCVAACVALTYPFVFQREQAENFTGAFDNEAFRPLNLALRWAPTLYNPEPECFAENVFHAERWRAETCKQRVNRTCWFVYVEKQALPPGKAALILTLRGGRAHGEGYPDARLCLNRALRFRRYPVEKRGEEYRLEFEVRPEDYRHLPQWPDDYLYLKFDHENLKPAALESADGRVTRIP